MKTVNVIYDTPKELFVICGDALIKKYIAVGETTSSFTAGQCMYKVYNDKTGYWSRESEFSYIPKEGKYITDDFEEAKLLLSDMLQSQIDVLVERLKKKVAQNLTIVDQIPALKYDKSITNYKLKQMIL